MHPFPVTLAPPPRHVPASLALINIFNGFAQIGWFLFGFGMVFVWMMVPMGDFSFLTFRGPHQQATGQVTHVEPTGAVENDHAVMANHYQFSVAGRLVKGTSYSLDSSASKGETVTVEYDESNPERSRIAGMRRGQFGPWVIFVGIFAFIGFAFIYFATRSGLDRNHVLRHGVFAAGTMINKERTNMTVNKRPVWKITYEFTARDGRRAEATALATDTTKLEDDAQEPLLYDPENPERAWVLDDAPARPELEMNGELRGRPVPALFASFIPGIVIFANLMAALFKLGVL